MKLRLVTALAAAALLGGCATYDYSAGSAPGGYYTGRPSVEYVGPYRGGYGYGSVLGGLSYGYGGYGYSRPYYGYGGGYYPYRPYRPYYPHPPRPRPDTDNGHPNPPGQGGRPPPWRNPDGRPHQIGQQRPDYQGGRPLGVNPGQPQVTAPSPRPVAPRPDRPRPVERAERSERPRSNNRIREVEP